MNYETLRSEHQKRVDKFMVLAGQDVPDEPIFIVPSDEIRILRAKLILEEAIETIYNGLGVMITVSSTNYPNVPEPNHWLVEPEDKFEFQIAGRYDPIETIDGCCDIKVVTTGTLSALGIPDEPFQKEVDENNLAKFGPGSYRREDGKWIKPPDHKPPEIAKILYGIQKGLQSPSEFEQEYQNDPFGFLTKLPILPEGPDSDPKLTKTQIWPPKSAEQVEQEVWKGPIEGRSAEFITIDDPFKSGEIPSAEKMEAARKWFNENLGKRALQQVWLTKCPDCELVFVPNKINKGWCPQCRGAAKGIGNFVEYIEPDLRTFADVPPKAVERMAEDIKDLQSTLEDPDFPMMQETRLVNRQDGKYLILRLDNPDDRVGYCSRMGGRRFAQKLWEHEEYRRMSEQVMAVINAIEEVQPPLTKSKVE